MPVAEARRNDLRQGISGGTHIEEVLRRVPEDKDLVRIPHQEALGAEWRSILGLLPPSVTTDDRMMFILKARAGVLTGQPMSMTDIGRVSDEMGGYPVSRQRVHAIIRSIKEETPHWERIAEVFPALGDNLNAVVMASPTRPARLTRKLKAKLRRFTGTLQYADLLNEIGLEIPAKRSRTAALLGEAETARAIWEDFQIVRVGKYRICSICREPILISTMYRTQSGKPYPRCRACNRKVTADWYKQHREAT